MKKLVNLSFLLIFMNFLYSADLKIVSWNIQTFFDSQTTGNEYSEFVKSEKWNENSYKNRLKKLCDSIKILDGDIVVLIELENKEILYDISNYLQDLSWKRNKLYKFSCFSKNSDSSIGCGILSRYEISKFSVHNIDVKFEKQPSMRPIIKAEFKDSDFELNLYVNHWKSMSGGQEKTEFWRNFQESLLSYLIYSDLKNGKKNIVACGDFNRDIFNFKKGKTDSSASLNHYFTKTFDYDFSIDLKSCWFDEFGNLVQPGSYYFNNEWSRIDHIFYTENIEVMEFSAIQNELWCNEEGVPDKYKIYSGTGFSDHLPLVCRLKLQ